MREIWNMIVLAGEYLLGLLVALITIVCILIGSIFGILELPKYLRMRAK
jgi:hypothetical protein